MTVDAKTLGEAILAAQFSTTIAKTRTFVLNPKDFPVNAIIACLAHGFQRKFNDAVGGADKSAEEKVSLAEAMIEDFKKGVVTKRRESAGVDPQTLAARKVMRKLVKDMLSKEDYKTFQGMEPVDQLAKLDAWAEQNADVIADAVAEEVKRAEEEAKQRGKLATKLTIAL